MYNHSFERLNGEQFKRKTGAVEWKTSTSGLNTEINRDSLQGGGMGEWLRYEKETSRIRYVRIDLTPLNCEEIIVLQWA